MPSEGRGLHRINLSEDTSTVLRNGELMETKFCGMSLYRPQPPRNPKLAPKHYVEQAAGKFIFHSFEEQVQLMQDYCSEFSTKMVVCSCHYCLEGLLAGSVDGRHIAQLLFQ